MDNNPEARRTILRTFTIVALVYSIVAAIIYWFVPGTWEGSTPVKAIFGNDLATPVLLYCLVILAAPVLGGVAVGLALGRTAKSKRMPNLIVGIVALAIGVSPLFDSVFSGLG
jgi:hypothetical protein